MSARVIDGKAIAAGLRKKVAAEAARLRSQIGHAPGLAAVLVGDDPASAIYVKSKGKATMEAGMASFEHKLPASASEADLVKLVERLNADPNVDGILIQLPLPPHMDSCRVQAVVDPLKDVDGLHPVNAGKLASGLPGLRPCTPVGCMMLAHTVHPSLAGIAAVVVGRSNIVGKPLAQLLLQASATVTIAHSKTQDLAGVCRRADLLCVAIGKAELVRGDWVKPGATVLDVGMNRVPATDGKSRLVGDVAYEEVAKVAGAITPVPGGVGPMTIACLLVNTLTAACLRAGLPAPKF